MADVPYDITDDLKRDVLSATDLVALVGAVTSLKKHGASWKGLCPFHGEKTPSFHVHPEKGFYYCFGCGAKGDAITFIRETERLDFPEAVAYLARRAGITLPVRRTGTRADRGKETRASEALAAAARFFRDELPRHRAARELLERRGVPLADAPGLGIGAAPDAWDGLQKGLGGTFPEDVLVEAGLLQKSPESGRVYDRFRNRLTIEIRDARGEVLGFGARALGDDSPKYLNTPETTRFSKGKLLYGLDRARDSIRKSETVVLVEGYFDRIALERAGVPNAVASMGTALTPAQADLLCRHAATVVVGYDGDPPGQAASRKAFPLLLERGARVRHLVLPDGHDPDSFLAARGQAALEEAVTGAPTLLEALVVRVREAGADASERASRLREAADILRAAGDRILRHELLAGLARGAGIPLAAVVGEEERAPASKVLAGRPEDGREVPEGEAKLLGLLLAGWPETRELAARIPAELVSHPDARSVLDALQRRDEISDTLDFSGLATHLGGGAGSLAARLLFSESEGGDAHDVGRREERIGKLLTQLTIRRLDEKGSGFGPRIAAAEAEGDASLVARLLGERQRMAADVRELKKSLKEPPQVPSRKEGNS